MPQTTNTIEKNFVTSVHVTSAEANPQAAYNALAYILWANRIALAIVFIWFGFLKLIHASPAEPLVIRLHDVTVAKYIPMQTFLMLLGGVECIIGILWLMPRYTKAAFWLFVPQMITTFMPLILLPKDTWQASFCLTLTGQYIIKNLVLVASAITVLYMHTKMKK